MDAYLQHLKSLRKHMNEHEDKMNAQTAKQHEERTIIHALQDDLNKVCQETNRLQHEIEQRLNERTTISNSMQRSQGSLVSYEAKCRGLAEALQALREENKKRSALLLEKKLYFEAIEATTRSAVEMCETGQKSCSLPTGAPGNEQAKEELQTGHAKPDDDREDSTSIMDVEHHLEELTDQRQLAENSLGELNSRYREMEIMTNTLQEKLLALQTEKTEEEEFLGSLVERLNQLKGLEQEVTCESCGQRYDIQYKGSDFIVRERSIRKFDDTSTSVSTEDNVEHRD